MGKIEDMRRQREQQFAEAEQRASKAGKSPKAAPEPAPMPAPRAAEPATPPTREPREKSNAKTAADDQGKCPDCGKMKPLQNGVMASHQKGFGKACPGSRKPPQ